ncbi:MAG: hypothetical protein JST22_11500 [Bacteroidetes bacterium]|nr:hypothetical protein [Bacteroidota bacterium]
MACKPATCPTCGGTDCFERPRFFSGQMLTDRDLDSAQRYVIEKNRLHNRYLVGTGVVCGLPVRCDRCDAGTVVVQPGYAIDCCGNDIVLCDPASFDVGAFIRACCTKDDGCGSKIGNDGPCGDLPVEYYLMLYYNEEPSRPVTALMRDNGCSNVRCEPSRTKETFRLALIEKEEYKGRVEPDMWARLKTCIAEVTAKIQAFETQLAALGQKNDPYTAAIQLFCKMRDYILQIYKLGPNNRCTLALELKDLTDNLPLSDKDADFGVKLVKAFFILFGYMFQYLVECICDALLVPCSSCEGDEGVILACLTVRKERVVKICNTARTQLLTGPAMRYWLHPLFAGIGRLVETFCCDLDLVGLLGNLIREPQGEIAVPGTMEMMGGKAMNSGNLQTETIGANQYNSGNPIYQGGDNHNGYGNAIGNPGTAAARTGSLFDMLATFGDNLFAGLSETGFLPLFTSPLMAMDLYHVPVKNATAMLDAQGVTYTTRQTTSDAEAYSFGHLTNMSWMIPPQSHVEVIVNPQGEVTAVRSAKEMGK